MDGITVLITGAGAPGIMGTIYSLKNNFDKRKIRLIGVDIEPNVIGKYMCDEFYKIPPPEEFGFLESIIDICKKEHVDVILPQVTRELYILADNKKRVQEIGTNIAISEIESLELVNNKFELLKLAEKVNIPVPNYVLVSNFDDLVSVAKSLGYPEKRVVIKPPISNGMRGLRILDANLNRKDMFYKEKPTSIFTSINELSMILGEDFPELLITEYLPGDEYTVDILRTKNKIIVVPRLREQIRSGITFKGIVKKEQKIIEFAKTLSEAANLMYAFGFQFKMNSENIPIILESNPRIQGTMIMSTFANANVIYGAVKVALNEELPSFKIIWDVQMLRYWSGVSVFNNKMGDKF